MGRSKACRAGCDRMSGDVPDRTLLPARERRMLLSYGGILLLLLNLAAPNGGLIGLPISFFLKNRLHLQAHQLAIFNLWVGAPLYFAFVFGFLRDRWSPLGAGDRGHFVLFGGGTAAIFAVLAFITPSYAILLLGVFAATAALQTVSSAANGLIASLGQEHLMAGQASTVVNIMTYLPSLIGMFLGGMFSEALEGEQAVIAARILFLVAAALMAPAAVMGAFGPKRLFTKSVARPRSNITGDIVRLLKHWPIYPPLIILLFWDFAPASGAVLQYHFVNALHGSDSQFGMFYAIFFASNIPTLILYGFLCQRIRLSKLLLLSTFVGIPQWMPLLLIHSPTAALWIAVPMGLMGGLGGAAYIDLAIRSCPDGLQGTMMMLVVTTAYYAAGRFGDVWGTMLYDYHGGFVTAVLATTAVYVLILPMLLLVPKRLISTFDGVAPEGPHVG